MSRRGERRNWISEPERRSREDSLRRPSGRGLAGGSWLAVGWGGRVGGEGERGEIRGDDILLGTAKRRRPSRLSRVSTSSRPKSYVLKPDNQGDIADFAY